MGSALVVLRRARNLISALFFLIAFSFAAAMAKEKAGWQKSFVLAVDGTWALIVGRWLAAAV